MTLDQIEEIRRGEKPSLSLRQAAENVRLPFRQCPACNGNGYTKATLLMSTKAMQALAIACPNETVAIQYDRCPRCSGAGGYILNAD